MPMNSQHWKLRRDVGESVEEVSRFLDPQQPGGDYDVPAAAGGAGGPELGGGDDRRYFLTLTVGSPQSVQSFPVVNRILGAK